MGHYDIDECKYNVTTLSREADINEWLSSINETSKLKSTDVYYYLAEDDGTLKIETIEKYIKNFDKKCLANICADCKLPIDFIKKYINYIKFESIRYNKKYSIDELTEILNIRKEYKDLI
jgi:hypothetical protein